MLFLQWFQFYISAIITHIEAEVLSFYYQFQFYISAIITILASVQDRFFVRFNST